MLCAKHLPDIISTRLREIYSLNLGFVMNEKSFNLLSQRLRDSKLSRAIIKYFHLMRLTKVYNVMINLCIKLVSEKKTNAKKISECHQNERNIIRSDTLPQLKRRKPNTRSQSSASEIIR